MFTMSKTQPSWAHFSLKFPIMIRPKPKPNKHKDLLQFQQLGQNKLDQPGPASSKVSNVVLFVSLCVWAFTFLFLTELGFKSSTYIGTYLYQVIVLSRVQQWQCVAERDTERERERRAMDSFSSSPSSGSNSQFQSEQLKNQLKAQLAQAYIEQFMEVN